MMLIKSTLFIILIFFIGLDSYAAEFHKCIDASGKTVFSDKQCAENAERFNVKEDKEDKVKEDKATTTLSTPAGPFQEGKAAYDRGDFAAAARWYRQAAEQGDAEAQYNLGRMYAHGQGVPKDDVEAVKWYRQAAEQGNAKAQTNLGVAYDDGEGVPQDDAEAVKWYRQAAEQGDADAQYNLGLMYAHGEGVPKDYAEAARWFRKAAEQGDAEAQTLFGALYADGKGVPQDYAEAMKWYRQAAEQGAAGAQLGLGLLYNYGQGVPQDYAEAARWFRKAAEQGEAVAQFKLGSLYAHGQGVPQDDVEAVKWYRKAAEQGNAKAQTNLGAAYDDGEGVPQDDAEAVKWYRKAAEQGDALAQNNLGLMYAEGQGVARDYVQALMWLTLATLGYEHPEKQSTEVAIRAVTTQMTPAQIEEAKRLVQERKPTAGPAPDKHPIPMAPAPVSKQQSSGLGNLTSLQGTLILMVSEDRGIPAKFWAKGNNMRLEASVGAKKTITIQVGDTLYTFNEGEKSGLKQHLGRGLGSMGLLRQIELIKTRGKKQGSKEFEGVLCDIYEYEAPQELALVYLSVATSLPQRWISTIRTGDTTSSIIMRYRNLEANVGIPDEMFKVPPEVKFSEQDKN